MFKYLLLVASAMSSISAYNILVVAPSPIVGHWLFFEEMIKNLLSRGHQVTTITNYVNRRKHENNTDIVVQLLNFHQLYPSKEIFSGNFVDETKTFWRNWRIGLLNSEHILKHSKVQELINDQEQQFDLVVADQDFHESFFLFAHKFKCPLVTVGTYGYNSAMDRSMGLITPLSFIPHPTLTHTNEMTFLQRCYNAFLSFYESIFRHFHYISKQNKLAHKYFRDGIQGEIPHVAKMERNVSLMLVNSHTSLHPPRPKMPAQVDIGGAHIGPVFKIASDLDEFCNEAEHGVIYFSFGTFIRSHEMPLEKFAAILETFKNIKQRVLWKFDGEISVELPPNVLVRKWFAQSDVLAHPKVVLFVTHGGLFGGQEALHRGVPMLIIPFFNEEQKAATLAERAGYGLSLQFVELTKETFSWKIEEMVTDQTYKAKAVAASVLFRDNPIHPMQKAMFWIEHAVRSNGAQHLRSTSVNLSWFKYAMVDVFLFYFVLFVAFFWFWAKIIKFCIKRYRSKEQKGKFKYY